MQDNAVLQFLGQILFKQLLHNLLITTSACAVFAITVSTHEEQYPCIGLVTTGPQCLTVILRNIPLLLFSRVFCDT